MSVKIPEQVQASITSVLNHMESTSELTKCIVVTRTGIKIAPDMDADTYSASSAALIDLGERVVSSLEHGSLQELVINALGGYVILVSVGKEYMLLGATSAALKMGYYLPYIREKSWELESLIYDQVLAGGVENLPVSKELEEVPIVEEKKPIIAADAIKMADMKAMNDVLAAFEEFGIDDEFSSSLGDDSVPAVGISKEEMASITTQLHPDVVPKPDITTSMSSPLTEYAAPVPVEQPAPAKVEISSSECPIPLEPGEVAPFPLPASELNPFGEAGQEASEIAPVIQEPVVPEPVQPEPVMPEPAMPEPVTAPVIAPSPIKPAPSSMPTFESAGEYDFDFNQDVQKDVVIQEKDSMADALKALGWEEEDN